MSIPGLARYRLLRRIGVGGMAEVFRAELVGAEGVTRELVVKKMHPALAMDPAAVAMFVDEARLAARLNHPNVVQVYEFGKAGDDYFLAMELVEGCDLATLVRAQSEPLPLGVTAYVANELLEGLTYVHELRDEKRQPRGLVHRDVSPHNVLLGARGEVKLADFGIAKAAERIGRETGQRGVGVKGKFAFMPPEQARGEPLDARADVFAVGAIVFELVSGQRPYRARSDGDLVEAVREGRLASLEEVVPGVDAGLAMVVGRALEPNRDDRYPSARAFREALGAVWESMGVRPLRAALGAAVEAVVAGGSRASERPERTLTVPPEPEPGEPEAPIAVEPLVTTATLPFEPKLSERPLPSARATVKGRQRVIVERIALAIGVFVVAVLAERRTRPVPHPERAGVPRASMGRVTLGVPNPELVGWLSGPLLAEVEAHCGCRIEVAMGAGDVELVSLEALPARLDANEVERLDVLLPEVDAPGFVALRTALRDEARRLGAASGRAGEGTYFVPLALDVVTLAVRRTALASLSEGVGTTRPEALTAVASCGPGRTLSAGFHADPGTWTTHDLFLAAHHWSTLSPRQTMWLPRAGLAAARVLSARIATFDVDGQRTLRDGLAWDSLMENDKALASQSLLDVRGNVWSAPSVAAAFLPVSQWIAEADDATTWTLMRLPRGDSLHADASGEPRAVGSRVSTGAARGWVVRRDRPSRTLAGRALLALSETAPMTAAGVAWQSLPARREADAVAQVREPRLRARMEAGLHFIAQSLEVGRFGVAPEDADRGQRVLRWAATIDAAALSQRCAVW